MACGFAAIVLAMNGNFYYAAMTLVLGGVFDMVDGRVARMTGTETSFGEQFDSISDIISFGCAPALIMYKKYLYQFDRLGAAIAFVYLLCAALRLARFNANINKVSNLYFQGLPTPAGALAIVGYIFLSDKYPIIDKYSIVAIFYTLIYAALMISNIPFSSFKNANWVQKDKRRALLFLFIASILIFIYYKILFICLILIYSLSSFILYIKNKKEFGDIFHWREESDSS